MSYKTIIGLEIHVELKTNTKIFCSCPAEFGGEENTKCCPVCLGLPGSLPVINKKVIEFAIRAGLALNCNINERSRMDRKNYFYPDLPKAYQISQYEIPLCKEGYIEIETENGSKKIRIRRIHIEEDTGKSIHLEDGISLLDYNRSGVPLIEIVTEPDMNSSKEVHSFLENLKSILEYIDISDCKMEQGSLRCDININVKNKDKNIETNIVELKNLNSFKAAVRAIDYEEKRHIDLLEHNRNTDKETRRWNDIENKTMKMRSKENIEDYRYFPDPDLVYVVVDRKWIDKVRKELPELPREKVERFKRYYNLSEYNARILASSKNIAKFFEDTCNEVENSKLVSNWIITEVLRRIKEEGIEIDKMKINHKDFASLMRFIMNKTISNSMAKKIFREMIITGKAPQEIIEERGLKQITDNETINGIIQEVLKSNSKSIEDYRNGKKKALGFLIGQVMKETGGEADPQIVNKLIKEALS
ncbi:Asp-tRNA(Asn)/Glu-tRNA(Gln) amidotransferase subunit GatB [Paramaledivibacter caminithermalis]|jgi:aspartyl-tRNA(Asn)/glutamyl-tRNA(Gln) amidotransferase subunit B|uniref:Aspartyl/glutamyl-tRNA(Asn/Gln) amidotransferase subunit B n=1 Tax=Paramaledivibacter caminithermalis (strain DSM 15212 / CIP 107654 / DViRD3) TaxID=1121301 RepID=A0A1M6NU23_PARC5|nr:Asp-tRNA(Asn)/Glu-tRNA(Gln) amidotransferase subunit GatB [Paramaledivibacter caminithermalis]SHJ99124.1 aspartyl/glutamyl-tRNA(Asn/Gln) amidotransferase subunit B [Paramaledivibacter caminithermalis DSM 15212]